MSDIKTTAIKKAIGLLAAAGAQYRVIYDGEELANTIPAPPEKPAKAYKKTGINYVVHFKPFVEQLQEGAAYVGIDVPEPYDVRAYRGALAGYLSKVFGNGTCITSINPEARRVEVLYAR